MKKWITILPALLFFVLATGYIKTVLAKGPKYACTQVRGAGNPKTVEANLNAMASKGYKFLYWDSNNYMACFKK